MSAEYYCILQQVKGMQMRAVYIGVKNYKQEAAGLSLCAHWHPV